MPIQNRVIPFLLAGLLTVGCAGDDAAESGSTQDTAASPATPATTAAEAETADTGTAGTTEAAVPTSGASAGAGGQDEDLEVCWSKGKSADESSYKLAGTIKLFPAGDPGVDKLVLVATDSPINNWQNGGVVSVYSVAMAMPGPFTFEVEDGPSSLYVCAFAPPTFDNNQSFQAAGCTATPITGKAGATTKSDDVELVVSSRSNPLVTLGGAQFGREAWTGTRVQRTVSGTVAGVKAQGFVIATASTPILEEEDSDTEPSGMAVAGADGTFSLTYFAAPSDPLFVCAMAFDDAQAPSTLTGTGCLSVKVSKRGRSGAKTFKDLEVELSADSEELDAEDAAHIALLQRCLGGV